MAATALDVAFQGAGSATGLEIWRIENFSPVPLAKENYGQFFSGDSYVVLHTFQARSTSSLSFHVFFWLGEATSQDESGTAALKASELDNVGLGGAAVQYREMQGCESPEFMALFKNIPFMILDGGVASGFKTVDRDAYEVRLFHVKGKRIPAIRQVPVALESLNCGDVVSMHCFVVGKN